MRQMGQKHQKAMLRNKYSFRINLDDVSTNVLLFKVRIAVIISTCVTSMQNALILA